MRRARRLPIIAGDMWLVPKTDPRPDASSTLVDTASAASLRAAFAGKADENDIARVLALFRRARGEDLWFACDCRVAERLYPLSAPAYLTTAGTYFLRRLTGPSRPNHAEDCLFRFERSFRGVIADQACRPGPIKSPTGLFSVLTPERRAHLTEAPLSAAGTGSPSPPRLARQLWRLMTMAQLNRLGPVQRAPEPSIKLEFASLRDVAERLDVHPGTALARVLATHPDDYHSKRLFARIRAAKMKWKDEDPLQGFLLVYVRDINGKTLIFDGADPVRIEGDLLRSTTGPPRTRGPYLALAVIGDHAGARGLAALRAYAQPVYSGRQFVPVAGRVERRVLKAINSARWRLARSHPHLEISLEKPLFDIETPGGPVLPDFMLETVDSETGELRKLIVDVIDPQAPADLEFKRGSHAVMSHLGEVLRVEPADLDDEQTLSRRIGDRLAAP